MGVANRCYLRVVVAAGSAVVAGVVEAAAAHVWINGAQIRISSSTHILPQRYCAVRFVVEHSTVD